MHLTNASNSDAPIDGSGADLPLATSSQMEFEFGVADEIAYLGDVADPNCDAFKGTRDLLGA